MTPRILLNAVICLLMLFAQHVALAESVTAAMYASGDHQCAIEDGSSSDCDNGSHVGLDDVDHVIAMALAILALPPEPPHYASVRSARFYSVVSLHYATRAPPLA